MLSAAFPGLRTLIRSPTHGAVKLSVARHSLVALSPSS
jgi:hypothetical protein